MISIIIFILFIITIFYLIIKFFNNKLPDLEIFSLFFIFLLFIFEIVYRSIQIKFIALTNIFESLYFFSSIIILILLIYKILLKKLYSNTILFIGLLIGFTLFAIASSPLIGKNVTPPIPALKSGWLILHVSITFIGESFFAISFASSIYYFITKNEEKRSKADSLIYKSIIIGYPLFTSGALLFGAIWAYYAWGRFWGWDPKESFAFVTWLVYTIYLHLRLLTKTKRDITVLISILGFLLTLFTFFGVNFLLSGLHSYK